ncbi:hypothetical protein D3C72_1351960 [compost metagenome]
MATTPTRIDQNTRCHSGVSSRPPEASMSSTRAPESAEVTKNTTTMATATSERKKEKGKCSRKANSASELSCRTVSTRPVRPWCRTMWMAVSPNIVIHSRVKPAGTKSTPQTNWRMVRPREMRAKNRPTKGDQDSHQPQ